MIPEIESWLATMLFTVTVCPPQWNNPCIALDTSTTEDRSSTSTTTSWSVKISTSLG